jgi:hypothetical protein
MNAISENGDILSYIEWHFKMDKLSNRETCIELLRSAPIGGGRGVLLVMLGFRCLDIAPPLKTIRSNHERVSGNDI